MKCGLIGTVLLVLTVLGNCGWAYDYGQGVDAPHPNSKYWRITGQRLPHSATPQRKHAPLLLRQENMLLREQVYLLKKQIQLLRQHRPCASSSAQDHLREEMATLQRSLHTLTRALSTVRRAQQTLKGF